MFVMPLNVRTLSLIGSPSTTKTKRLHEFPESTWRENVFQPPDGPHLIMARSDRPVGMYCSSNLISSSTLCLEFILKKYSKLRGKSSEYSRPFNGQFIGCTWFSVYLQWRHDLERTTIINDLSMCSMYMLLGVNL